MAKQLFIAGGITAEDYSYLRALALLAVQTPEVRDLLPDPPPPGILGRLEQATLVTMTNEQQIIVAKEARIIELEEQASGPVVPSP